MSSAPRVAVVAASAVCALGFEWRGLGAALASAPLVPAKQLASSHPDVVASEAPPDIPGDLDPADSRQRKLMSRAARLAAVAARRAVRDAGWEPEHAAAGPARPDVGYFLGVGASGGSIEDLAAVLRASVADGRLSLARLGDAGLSATNPVATFQLLNNFTLCHSAILEGTGGPNGALFSRGGGTVAALIEAAAAVADGSARRALAGGADSALHALTWGELVGSGLAAEGLVPGEGAAVLALERAPDEGDGAPPLAFVERSRLLGARAGAAALEDALDGASRCDLAVIAPWGDPARAVLERAVAARLPHARVLDVTARLGESLAATPALAWAVALDRLAAGDAERAVVLSAGIDRQLGVVELARGGAR